MIRKIMDEIEKKQYIIWNIITFTVLLNKLFKKSDVIVLFVLIVAI